ncbi:hypothetical protein ES708_16582 [subsurface metagenome]
MIVAILLASVTGALVTFLALAPSNVWLALIMAPLGGSLLGLLQGTAIAVFRLPRSPSIDALTDRMVADLNRAITAARRSSDEEGEPVRFRETG